MKLKIIALLATILSSASAQPSQPTIRLANVKRIFVDHLGDASGAEELRYKIQNRLSKTANLTVVPTPTEADAVLKGLGELTGNNRAKIVVQLVSKTDRILWGGETPTECAGATEGIAAVLGTLGGQGNQRKSNCDPARAADLVVKQLLKAIEKDQRTKQ